MPVVVVAEEYHLQAVITFFLESFPMHLLMKRRMRAIKRGAMYDVNTHNQNLVNSCVGSLRIENGGANVA